MVRRNGWEKPWPNLGWKIPCAAPDVQRDKINAPDPGCPQAWRPVLECGSSSYRLSVSRI